MPGMETSSHPPQTIDLAKPLYYQLVYTLTDLLPPPLDDSPAALRARNHAAIAKVAALLPVNANEADLAAQCIAARAQAEDMLRLIRHQAGDIALVMRLNAQYTSMVRTSLAAHARLMRVQAVRQKREATEGTANQDIWAQHIAERSMLAVVNPDAAPNPPAWPEPAPTPPATPTIQHQVSEQGTNSHNAAFETWLSRQLLDSTGSEETDLHALVRETMARAFMLAPDPPPSSRASPH